LTRRLNFWLFAFLLIIGIPCYWFLLDAGSADVRAKPVTMAQLRTLADAVPGPRPTQLRAETIGADSHSINMLAAGMGMRRVPTAVRAYELVVPGKAPIIINAGTTRDHAIERDVDGFNQAAQDRINRAVRKAAKVVVLADDDLRNGGMAPAAQPRMPPAAQARMPPAAQAGTLAGNAPFAIAPGIVAIPLAGLTPGSLMIYVRLADGRELLFTGEGANIPASWRQLRPPARLALQSTPDGYRAESMAWLTTINALNRQAPQMQIVTGHDSDPVPFSSGTFSD
jgi:hypothetical protein